MIEYEIQSLRWMELSQVWEGGYVFVSRFFSTCVLPLSSLATVSNSVNHGGMQACISFGYGGDRGGDS